jgi:hypothetical protein
MDIIAAHQQGLIEQLDGEVEALGGRPRDHAQRAMVLHHLYDHSRGSHVWALAEARRSLRTAQGIARLERRVSRWGWTVRKPEQAEAALEKLAEALGEATRGRTIAAYRAYRLSATKALRGEAEATLPGALLGALDQCHHHRREGESLPADISLLLDEESERLAEASIDHDALADAWGMVEATSLRRAARRLLGPKALANCRARDERKGWVRIDRELRRDPALPAAFRANPAQHFYAMHRALADRRRQQWRELCDLEADAVALAA